MSIFNPANSKLNWAEVTIYMSQSEYLSVLGAVLFALAISFYLLSWISIIRNGNALKETKFLLWSLGFFLLTLVEWYANFPVTLQMNTLGKFLTANISIALLFVISGIINKENDANWAYLKDKIDEVCVVTSFYFLWSIFYYQIYLGIDEYRFIQILMPVMVALTVLWFFVRKEWPLWIFLTLLYSAMIFYLISGIK